jgi:hypothetical protein
MAIIFDAKHRPPRLEGKVFLKVTKLGKPGYHVPNQSSLSPKKLGPFRIIRKVSPLAYELELPDSMRNHPVISVIHLEQAKEDPFERTVPTTPPPLTENGEEVFVVEKILKERSRRW